MRIQTVMGSLLATITLMCLSGCALLDAVGIPSGEEVPYNPKEPGENAVHKNAQFADIPVPLNFIFRRHDSFSYQGQTMRFAHFRYDGSWSMRQTTAFYRAEMDGAGWQHLRTTKTDTEEVQMYQKGRERCHVLIHDTINAIEVTIRVNNPKRK